jgi:hypothetical protein
MVGLKNIFKRKIPKTDSISDKILQIQKMEASNLHISIYIKNQILFQIMPIRHFGQHGMEIKKADNLASVHFFNKNKTLTIDSWSKFKETELSKDYFYYEEPKNNHN